ncbi:YecR family lipoprotein [Citrobacter sp. wls714]|uniref:YecR family lipoprotein n=1 Tax=Citrobacter sp. wls714 TaxID=2576422 RepID=UPI0010C979A4|nr:hypothetical protein FDX11_23390 [Citrobacter sp. wls714]
MIPVEGSKADGTIIMGYSYGVFGNPNIDLTQVHSQASQKCRVWDYNGAEAFCGQVMRHSLITSDGEAIDLHEQEGVRLLGVVAFFINQAQRLHKK